MSSISASRKPHVVGGKLKLKGSSGSSKRSSGTPSSSSLNSDRSASSGAQSETQISSTQNEAPKKVAVAPGEEYLTPAQKRHLQRKIEKEREDAKKLSKTSFRDRVDIFNDKLAKMTEHNDIPRISAAGNG